MTVPGDPYQVRPGAPDTGGTTGTRPTPAWVPAPAPSGPRQWRVRPVVTVLKAIGAALFAAAGLWNAPDPGSLVVGLGGALVLLALVVRDLVAGVRLSADTTGITAVTGFAGRRHVPWSSVERVRVDRRNRFGLRTELVEVDSGDDLYLFSANELAAPCDEVVASLTALWEQAGGPSAEQHGGPAHREQDEDQ